MPPIKNWVRARDLEQQLRPQTIWHNETTDQVVWLSDKVPNDGYYGFITSRSQLLAGNYASGRRVAYSPAKDEAYSMTIEWLRNNPDGKNL